MGTDTIKIDAADRHVIRIALTNHATALQKEAVKLEILGHTGMADNLMSEFEHITEKIKPIFDEQRSLALG